MQSSCPSTPQLIYLAFGPATYHQEACFSIISALAHLRPDEHFDIQVYTDNPAPYADLPVTVHLLDEATRTAWNQPHGYHFRSKHVLLREVLRQHPLAVLIDTDTFFRQSPLRLFDRVRPGTMLCNATLGRYGDNPNCVLHQTLLSTLKQRGLADEQMPLLNSGVIGLCAQDAGLLDHSIALMDEFYPIARKAYTLEEFCLSVAAYRNLEVAECTDVIHHYWSRKAQFRAKIQAWLHKHAAAPLGEAARDDVRRVNDQLPRPPTLRRLGYKAMSLTLPRHQRQFARELLYGCYPYPNEFDRACATAWWDKALENFTTEHGPQAPEQLLECLEQPGLRLPMGARRHDVEAYLLGRSHG